MDGGISATKLYLMFTYNENISHNRKVAAKDWVWRVERARLHSQKWRQTAAQ